MGDDDNYVKRIKKVPTPLWKKRKIRFLQKESRLNIYFLSRHIGKVGCAVMETLPWLKGGIPCHSPGGRWLGISAMKKTYY